MAYQFGNEGQFKTPGEALDTLKTMQHKSERCVIQLRSGIYIVTKTRRDDIEKVGTGFFDVTAKGPKAVNKGFKP